jgi:hypothetical protein
MSDGFCFVNLFLILGLMVSQLVEGYFLPLLHSSNEVVAYEIGVAVLFLSRHMPNSFIMPPHWITKVIEVPLILFFFLFFSLFFVVDVC